MIVGIDLGTTFSAIARLNSTGVPVLCPDRRDNQSFHTPSVVHVKNGILVGDSVEKFLMEDPSLNVCRFAKRKMGTADLIYKDAEGYEYPAHGVSALILRKLKLDAEVCWSQKIEKAVVSIPAHFNEAQRQATFNAARLAELPIVGLEEEPVAAATFCAACLAHKKDERTLFIFDLGGGTLDCTVLQSTPEGLYVLATEGAEAIGGKNFDELIMDMALEQYTAQYQDDPSQNSAAMQALRMFSTNMKLELARAGVRRAQRPLLINGNPLNVTVTREQFDAAAEVLLDACVEVCERVLKAAKLDWGQIDDFMMTGGGSQLPCVEERLRTVSEISGDRIHRHQPRASIAYGVALLANQKYGSGAASIAPPLRQTVSTNELGLVVMDPATQRPVFECLVEKNLSLPVFFTKKLYGNTQKSREIVIMVQQRKDRYTPPETLGRFHFGPLPPNLENIDLEVKLGYDEAGRVSVNIRDVQRAKTLDKIIGRQEEADLAELGQRVNAMPIL
jgi:molecular chaperone DnaK